MALPKPDGMGMDRHRERQNMRQAHADEPTHAYTVLAVDSDGEVLYEAEIAWSEQAAHSEREACEALLKEHPENFDDAVAGFRVEEV